MPSDKKNKKTLDIENLAIIAGSGHLPRHVYDACIKKKIKPLVIGVEGEVEKKIFSGIKFENFCIHSVSKIVKKLKEEGINNVVLAGKVRRADISKLLLDLKGAKLFTMILKSGINDNAILSTIIKFLEGEGFNVLPPELIAETIVMEKGTITKKKPDTAALDDIKVGLKTLKEVTKCDIGQALVIQGGLVLGIEAAEGTDELIKRCGQIKQDGEGPILIKISKQNQDQRVDLPCIGATSVRNAHKYGIRGIAVEASHTLVLERKEMIDAANELGIFIHGI